MDLYECCAPNDEKMQQCQLGGKEKEMVKSFSVINVSLKQMYKVQSDWYVAHAGLLNRSILEIAA